MFLANHRVCKVTYVESDTMGKMNRREDGDSPMARRKEPAIAEVILDQLLATRATQDRSQRKARSTREINREVVQGRM